MLLGMGMLRAVVLTLAAHPMPNALVHIRVSGDALRMEISIPVPDLRSALGADSILLADFQAGSAAYQSDTAAIARLKAYFAAHCLVKTTDGRPWQMSFSDMRMEETSRPLVGRYAEWQMLCTALPPPGADARSFLFYYDAVLHQVVTHQAVVSIAQDWAGGLCEGAKQVAVVQVESETGRVYPVAVDLGTGSTRKGFTAMFRLGMRHIAEGTDHLLFLLLLVLVSPLVVVDRRWGGFAGWYSGLWKLFAIVTAFTIGHSLTLALCSLRWVAFSGPWVEVAIALSILISALHALWPLFGGREPWIAAFFGLIHGMAFSDVLVRLSLDHAQLIWSLAGFNLGIEAIQLALVAVVAPFLFVLARTRFYPLVRLVVGAIGVVAALYWIWMNFNFAS